ncbi:hypothetical protein [Mariniphaga sediminis]
MNFLKRVLAQLDKIKVILKFIRALDAAIDAFKAVVELDENKRENEKIS